MPDLDTDALLCNNPSAWSSLLNRLKVGNRRLGLSDDDLRRLKRCQGPNLADGYRVGQPLYPASLPLQCVTPFEQVSYIAALGDLAEEVDPDVAQFKRVWFARRVSQARERRRELAIRLFQANPIDPEQFLDLAVGLAMRPFAVPPLLLEDPPTLLWRITTAEFAAFASSLRYRPYDDDLVEQLRALQHNAAPERLSVRVENALTRVFGPETERPVPVSDACTWIKTAAELAEPGIRVRTVRAMYAPSSGNGQTIDLIIALIPRTDGHDEEIPLANDTPRGFDTVLRAAYAAVTSAVPQQRGWKIRAWLHDLPGGFAGDGPVVDEISSAGVASAIAIASALNGRPICDDIVSTGIIHENGRIGSVAATIPSKVGGLFGWLNPALDTNPYDPKTFAKGFVPKDDLDAALSAADRSRDRIQPLTTVKDDVLSLDRGPLERPRFERYLTNPFSAHEQNTAAADVTESINGLIDRFLEKYQPTALTTALLPWWLPKDGKSRTDLESGLHLVRAEWIGDGLLVRFIDEVRDDRSESIPVFLKDPDDNQSALQTSSRTWLPEAVQRIVTAASDHADRYTITQMLSEGHFTLLVDADRLNSDAMRRVLQEATGPFKRCRWIFLSHATRCGQPGVYARHRDLIGDAFQRVDLLEEGQNSSVWDGYIRRTANELVQQRAGNGALKTDGAWLDSYFGNGRYLGGVIPRYLPRRLGSPQESADGSFQAGPRRAPATLDSSAQGLFSQQRAYPLEIIEARSGRGKSLVGLHTMFVWLRGGEAGTGKFGVVPVFLDANLHSSRRNSIQDALNADGNRFERAIGSVLNAVLQGEHLDSGDPERVTAKQEFKAILDALGNPERTPYRELQLLLNGLGPMAVMIDGLREVPDSKLKAERIVPNLIQLADTKYARDQPVDDNPGSQLPLSRVVLFWRSDVVKTAFAKKFAEQLRGYEQQHRISELLPFNQKELLSQYLEPAFERKPQVLEELKREPGLLATLANNLRVLDAVTRLEEQDVNDLKKEVIERRWDSDEKKPVDQSFKQLTGGRILRWALIKDYQDGFANENGNRQWDNVLRALPPFRRRDRERELIALGLLAFLATAKGEGLGQLTLAEVGPVLNSVFNLGKDEYYNLWQGTKLVNEDADPVAAYDAGARELERITKRVWVKGDQNDPDQWRLDFRHEEDRVLATVWLIDCVLHKHDDPKVKPSLALSLRDTDGAGAGRVLRGLDLVRYAFALDKGLSRYEVNKQRAEWSAIRLLFEEASEEPRLLFDLPEVRQILSMP